MPSVRDEYRFDELTWPEVNEAVKLGKIPIIPTGSVEQHGHHLPLKVDHLCANAVATAAARLRPEISLVLPPVSYGYVHHVMDFPGSINIHFEHFIQFVLDICKSLAYHGFKKMVIVNGHGSNGPLVDLAARRLVVETDAHCVFCNWWQLLQVDPEFSSRWRESVFPGGCAHAGELETSMLLHLAPESVRADKIKSEIAKTNKRGSRFTYADLFGSGAVGDGPVDEPVQRQRRDGRGRESHGREGQALPRGSEPQPQRLHRRVSRSRDRAPRAASGQ